MVAIHIRITMIKITKFILISTFFISSVSFADTPNEEQVTLSSIVEVISFCSSDKTCTSVKPVIETQELTYDVKYESFSVTPPPIPPTDPTEGDVDD